MIRKALSDKLIVAVLFLVLLAGCAVGPDYREPKLAMPAYWQEAQQKGVEIRQVEMAR